MIYRSSILIYPPWRLDRNLHYCILFRYVKRLIKIHMQIQILIHLPTYIKTNTLWVPVYALSLVCWMIPYKLKEWIGYVLFIRVTKTTAQHAFHQTRGTRPGMSEHYELQMVRGNILNKTSLLFHSKIYIFLNDSIIWFRSYTRSAM